MTAAQLNELEEAASTILALIEAEADFDYAIETVVCRRHRPVEMAVLAALVVRRLSVQRGDLFVAGLAAVDE